METELDRFLATADVVRVAPNAEWDSRRAGLEVTTTLDLSMQRLAERIAAETVTSLQPRYGMSNGALVALDPQSGGILAMVGSIDFDNESIDGQVNVATSRRQPGSAIKPILYAAALDDSTISPATVIWDTPVRRTQRIKCPVKIPGIFCPIEFLRPNPDVEVYEVPRLLDAYFFESAYEHGKDGFSRIQSVFIRVNLRPIFVSDCANTRLTQSWISPRLCGGISLFAVESILCNVQIPNVWIQLLKGEPGIPLDFGIIGTDDVQRNLKILQRRIKLAFGTAIRLNHLFSEARRFPRLHPNHLKNLHR